MAVEFIKTSDSRIAYEKIGKGPAMVFIHGWPLNRKTYYGLVDKLKEDFTCYLIDSAGLGESSWDKNTDFSFPGHARRIIEWADKIGLSEYLLTAHNTGASIARLTAAEDSRVKQLIMINTEIPFHRPPYVEMYQFLFRLPLVTKIVPKLLASTWYLKSPLAFGGSFYDSSLIEGAFRKDAILPLIQNSESMHGAIEYIKGLDWKLIDSFAENLHPKLTIPVHLIWGEADPTFPLNEAEKMNKQFKDSRPVMVVPDSKLLVHQERPDEVAGFILEAVGKQKATVGS